MALPSHLHTTSGGDGTYLHPVWPLVPLESGYQPGCVASVTSNCPAFGKAMRGGGTMAG